MHIIFLGREGRQRFQLGAGVIMGALVVVALSVSGAFLGGMSFGISSVKVPPTGVVSLWDQDLALQEAAVKAAITDAEDDLTGLAVRVGGLQAQSIRLNALGARLVELARLDPKEFAFGEPPALGGLDLGSRNPNGDPAGTSGDKGSVGSADLLASLRGLAADLEDREPKLEALQGVLLNRDLEASIYPTGRPRLGGWISSHYGSRIDPVSGRKSFHHGIDFPGARGSKVLAVADGVVSDARKRKGYGNTVTIVHADGYSTLYAHNQKNLVSVGAVVKKGQPIALMGSTGKTTGSHVHYEIHRNGKPINPQKWIQR